jgi:hypothetical protein
MDFSEAVIPMFLPARSAGLSKRIPPPGSSLCLYSSAVSGKKLKFGKNKIGKNFLSKRNKGKK